MKLWVNLYQADLKPVVQRLTLTRVLLAAAAILLLGIVINTALSQWLAHTQAQVTELQQQLKRQTQQQAELQQQLAQHTGDAELLAAVADLQTRLQHKQQLLTQVQQLPQQQQLALAQLLTDLANLPRQPLWLTDIQVSADQLILIGRAQQAASLPRWLDSFAQAPSLQQRRFDVVSLDQNQQGVLQFTLQTQLSQPTSEAP
ncbi:PilN domain-containing protein [Idiomarina xiamenensis]|uniref:Type II secretory pathway component n=1 Tax=Idiomarina xiamenensis 10-D-4 TaxID=740709 RepID=K2JPH4_9GAMM|nr:PilN domain-containing protein [Idiomarina xiamenensis]EKE85411.1 Type II secretory pathway component [Idiomarina xiamenensis 10-D-4]